MAGSKQQSAKTSKPAVPVVTNNHTGTLCINGVNIGAGESAEVPGFNPDHGVMKKWIEAEVISVIEAEVISVE